MKARVSWMCMAALVGAAVVGGCATSPTTVTKYDAAFTLEEKADKAQNGQMKARDYTDAIAKYNEFIAQDQTVYPELMPYAMFKIARCYRGLGQKDEAMTAYKQVLDKYPGSKPAEWARAESAELEGMTLMPLPAPMAPGKPMPMK